MKLLLLLLMLPLGALADVLTIRDITTGTVFTTVQVNGTVTRWSISTSPIVPKDTSASCAGTCAIFLGTGTFYLRIERADRESTVKTITK